MPLIGPSQSAHDEIGVIGVRTRGSRGAPPNSPPLPPEPLPPAGTAGNWRTKGHSAASLFRPQTIGIGSVETEVWISSAV